MKHDTKNSNNKPLIKVAASIALGLCAGYGVHANAGFSIKLPLVCCSMSGTGALTGSGKNFELTLYSAYHPTAAAQTVVWCANKDAEVPSGQVEYLSDNEWGLYNFLVKGGSADTTKVGNENIFGFSVGIKFTDYFMNATGAVGSDGDPDYWRPYWEQDVPNICPQGQEVIKVQPTAFYLVGKQLDDKGNVKSSQAICAYIDPYNIVVEMVNGEWEITSPENYSVDPDGDQEALCGVPAALPTFELDPRFWSNSN